MKSSTVWRSVLDEIENNISAENYSAWFEKTKGLDDHLSKDRFTVSVPNSFAKKQLETKFGQLVKDILKKNNVSNKDLHYKVCPPKTSPKVAEKADSGLFGQTVQKQQANHQRVNGFSQKYRSSLNPIRYTFENFVTGSNNELAFAACQAILNDLGHKYNPLFIYGGVGVGKTHLAQAVGNEVLSKNQGLSVVYATIEQFVQEFTDSIRYKKIGSFANHYRGTDVLIIDDMQFIENKEKTQEEFFHTFNILHSANKQVIITSDKPPEEIPTLEKRLISRFQMGMVIDIQAPDLETRCAILQMKADNLGFRIDRDSVEFLALNFTTNVRELEGALNKLNVHCEANKISQADLATTRAVFNQDLKSKQKRITAKLIIEKVANYYGLNQQDLVSPKREKEVVLARQMAMYLMRDKLQLPFLKIAKLLNRKDHTVAIHSINKINKLLIGNHEIQKQLKEIKEMLV